MREIAVELVRADGERLPALINSVLVRDGDGEPQGVRTTVFDATERKSYERELLAARDRERSAREQARDVARELARSLIGEPPPPDPRYELATLYRPAVEGLEVGGDWYDVFTLSRQRVAVVVGDVVGRGLVAAKAMGQLRSAVRALAAAGFGPAAILRHLDTFVEQVEDACYATLAYAEVDPGAGGVAFATAGHMPPVMLAPHAPPSLFMEGRSLPLGVATGGERREANFILAPGAGFLLYTDGLVERRREPIDAGLDRLLSAVGAVPDRSPAQIVATVQRELLGERPRDDDVCLLGFRLRCPE